MRSGIAYVNCGSLWGRELRGKDLRYDTFISHASANLAAVRPLVEPLKDRGLQIFFGKESIPPGQHWTKVIDQAVKSSRCLVVMLSSASCVNGNVLGEVELANESNVPILPVLVEDFELPKINQFYAMLFGIQRVQGFGDTNRAVGEICKFIEALGPANAAAPAPSPAVDASPSLGAADRPTSSEPRRRGISSPDVARDKKARSTASPAQRLDETPKAAPRPAATYSPEARKELISRLERDVDRGDRESAYLLGRLNAAGVYVAANEGMAVRYFRLAADGVRGLPAAMHDLAECYRLGRGVGRSAQKAIELHERAAVADFAPSFYRLGRIYWLGADAPQNFERAYRRFKRAADLGYPPACFRLAEILLTGLGAPRNLEKAFEFAMLAAERHDPAALNLVGRFYRRGIVVQADDATACDWYRRAMEQGSPEGALNLSSMYRRGLGVDQSELQAMQLNEISRRLMHGDSVVAALGETSFRLEGETDQAHGN